MNALIAKYGLWIVGGFAVVGVALLLLSRPTPKPDVIQQAAQDAAAAIVTVEHADSALARHQADSAVIVALTAKYQGDSVTRVSLQRRLLLVEKHIPVIPDVVDRTLASPAELVARWKARADTAILAVLVADSVIVQDSVVNHGLIVANEALRGDNASLTSHLAETKIELAKHRIVVIPLGASAPGFHFPNLLKGFVVSVGYGAQYNVADKRITLGPVISLGVRIPL